MHDTNRIMFNAGMCILTWLDVYQKVNTIGKEGGKDVIFTAEGKESNDQNLVQLEPVVQ